MNWDYKALYDCAIEQNADSDYRTGWMKACLSELKSLLDSGLIESNEYIINKLNHISDSAENAEKDFDEII